MHVYGLTRVLVFLLVDETMQYRQQCRFTINQNLRVYHIIKIFEEKPWSLCAYVRSDQGPSVFDVDETMQYRQQCRFTIIQNLRVNPILLKYSRKTWGPWSYCACVRSDQGPSVFACGRHYAI